MYTYLDKRWNQIDNLLWSTELERESISNDSSKK